MEPDSDVASARAAMGDDSALFDGIEHLEPSVKARLGLPTLHSAVERHVLTGFFLRTVAA